MPPTPTRYRTSSRWICPPPRSRRPPQRKPGGDRVSLGASNLFNKTYYSCYDQNNCWFGAERSVEARLKYAF